MRFSVLSYNVLHEFGASRLLRARGGGGVPAWAKDRLVQAANVVRQMQPDIVCLQEVDEAAQAAMQRTLGDDFECASTMCNESLPPRDGCSLFVRKGRLEVVATHQFRMRDTAVKHFPEVEGVRGRAAGMTAAFWRELHEKLNMAVAVKLRASDGQAAGGSSGAELCVATTHLFWDPQYPDLKLLQAFFLARELEEFAAGCPLVLAGDLNSTPYTRAGSALSGVYALLTQGAVGTGHPDHPVALRRGGGILSGVAPVDVPGLSVAPFKSAYREAFGAEAPVTNASKDFRGCLDYILFREGLESGGGAHPGLRLVGARPLPSDAEIVSQLPLPSPLHPSDHLPILAEFEMGGA